MTSTSDDVSVFALSNFVSSSHDLGISSAQIYNANFPILKYYDYDYQKCELH